MSRAVDQLQAQVEVLKLARLLGRQPDDLSYLAPLPAGDLRRLRDGVTELLYDGHDDGLDRLAAVSRVLPPGVTATISQRAFGPLLSARLAGLLDTDRAVEIAGKLPSEFLADIAIELDPRHASDLIVRIEPELIAAVTTELVGRQEYVAMGRFVGHLSDESLKAALQTMDDRALLQVGFVLEDKNQLPRLIGKLSKRRIAGIIAVAAEEDLWVQALDLLNHLTERQRSQMVLATLALPRPALGAVLAAVVEHDLWSEILLIAEHDTMLQSLLAEEVPALPPRRRRAAAQRARDTGTLERLGLLGDALSAS